MNYSPLMRFWTIGLCLPLFLLLACHSGSPEEQVRKSFQACIKGIEQGDAGSVVEILAPDFSGPEGMSRDEAKLFLLGVLSREKIGVTVLSDRIEVQGTKAFQTTSLILTGKSGSSLLPEESSRKAYTLRWQKRDGRWRLKEITENR